jgi:hypothetical protein
MVTGLGLALTRGQQRKQTGDKALICNGTLRNKTAITKLLRQYDAFVKHRHVKMTV